MRRLSGVVLAGAILLLPAFSQNALAAQQAAPQKFTMEGDLALWSVSIRPDKTADYEQVLAKVKEALTKSHGARGQAAAGRLEGHQGREADAGRQHRLHPRDHAGGGRRLQHPAGVVRDLHRPDGAEDVSTTCIAARSSATWASAREVSRSTCRSEGASGTGRRKSRYDESHGRGMPTFVALCVFRETQLMRVGSALAAAVLLNVGLASAQAPVTPGLPPPQAVPPTQSAPAPGPGAADARPRRRRLGCPPRRRPPCPC